MKIIVFTLIFLLLTPISVFCIDCYVSTTGSNDDGDGTAENPWQTITYALSQVSGSSGDPAVINIAAGTYNTVLGESFPLMMKSYISLKGANRETTILDASGAEASVIYSNGVDNITVDALTLTGGIGDKSSETSDSRYGGGIYIDESFFTVSDCVITGNMSDNGSGIVCAGNSMLMISNSVLSYNTTDSFIGNCIATGPNTTLQISETEISSNDGRGIDNGSYHDFMLTNCTVKNNSYTGIYCGSWNNKQIITGSPC